MSSTSEGPALGPAGGARADGDSATARTAVAGAGLREPASPGRSPWALLLLTVVLVGLASAIAALLVLRGTPVVDRPTALPTSPPSTPGAPDPADGGVVVVPPDLLPFVEDDAPSAPAATRTPLRPAGTPAAGPSAPLPGFVLVDQPVTGVPGAPVAAPDGPLPGGAPDGAGGRPPTDEAPAPGSGPVAPPAAGPPAPDEDDDEDPGRDRPGRGQDRDDDPDPDPDGRDPDEVLAGPARFGIGWGEPVDDDDSVVRRERREDEADRREDRSRGTSRAVPAVPAVPGDPTVPAVPAVPPAHAAADRSGAGDPRPASASPRQDRTARQQAEARADRRAADKAAKKKAQAAKKAGKKAAQQSASSRPKAGKGGSTGSSAAGNAPSRGAGAKGRS